MNITNSEEYISLISREPLSEMIQQGNGYRYIKKSVLKKELLAIFGGNTKFEVIDKTISKNGLYGSGLFHYQHPVTKEWLFESGMAAIPHQSSLKLDYPALKAQIFKNAVREIGIWFGQTLNLDDDEEVVELNLKDEMNPTVSAEMDIEWQKIKDKLSKIKWKEEAQEYIDTTSYNMTIEAKQIINSKKSKNEKK